MAMEANPGEDAEDYAIVTLTPMDGVSAMSINETPQKALQKVETVDGVIQVTTILPATLTDTGEIENSYAYAEELAQRPQTRGSHSQTIYFQNSVFTSIVAFYTMELGNDGGFYYRQHGIQGKWGYSGSGSVSVQKMELNYTTRGSLHSYPACLTKGYNATLLSSDYTTYSHVSKSSPTKGVIYSDTTNITPSGRAICVSNIVTGMSVVGVHMVYTVNGTSYNLNQSINLEGQNPD